MKAIREFLDQVEAGIAYIQAITEPFIHAIL